MITRHKILGDVTITYDCCEMQRHYPSATHRFVLHNGEIHRAHGDLLEISNVASPEQVVRLLNCGFMPPPNTDMAVYEVTPDAIRNFLGKNIISIYVEEGRISISLKSVIDDYTFVHHDVIEALVRAVEIVFPTNKETV